MSDSVQLSAIFKNAGGTVLPGLTPDGWDSSDNTIATVSQTGLVTSIGAGSAIITARYQTLRSNGCAVSVYQQGTIDSNHPNQPVGMTQLVPLLDGSTPIPTEWTPLKWVSAGIGQATDTVPGYGSTTVYNINYPPGQGNGTAPGRAYTQMSAIAQDFPPGITTIYISYWYKVSPNFPASLNANKMMYLQINHANSWGLHFGATADQGNEYTAPLHPRMPIQNIKSINGNTTITQDFWNWNVEILRGQWFFVEGVGVANTAGNADGDAKMFVNGSLVIHEPNIAWDVTGAAGQWNVVLWDPVYNLAIPADAVNAYHRLKDLYISGR